MRSLKVTAVSVVRAGAVRTLHVTVENGGNLTERLLRGRVTVALRRAGRTVTTLKALPRDLLPGTRGSIEVRYRGRLRGRVVALVRVRPLPAFLDGPAAPELGLLERAFAVRL